ncbi:long chain base biosynthesis protein 2d-like [Neltuma alba]|uniref:long chain base biosynthesis protein 2d-like n=1 Tax=Neltuma alba TaxID=207710 RepID=UPI0010A3C301|nr:long chain base biosynthesis protein 2d-like [Prosopis alba]
MHNPITLMQKNEGSYNYLGFAASDEYCTPRAIESLRKYSASTCSSRVDGGTTALHNELETCVANFVGKPAAIVFGMGYVTNSAVLPVLMGEGSLIISDSLNHNSIVNGARGSGATIRVFRHNTPSHLEEVLREQIAEGRARTHSSWKKIIVDVEGIYSMEGELCKLPGIIAICKKYQNVFRSELEKMGFEVLGDNNSPIIPIMVYNIAKIPAFSRERLKRNVAVVAVAFPATPLLLARAGICISAAHSKEDLIKALEVISKVGDLAGIKYLPVKQGK